MLAIVVCAAWVGANPAVADTWLGFRNDGTSRTTARQLPVKWSPRENIAWRTELPGYGQSSPVVWKDRVFLTAIDGPQKEKLFILALDSKTGHIVWKKEYSASQTGKNNPMMSRAAPTPVVDRENIYSLFESGDLFAHSHDGGLIWHVALTQKYGEIKNNHGLGSSLAQSGRAVFVQVDHAGPSYLLAVDKATGKELWKAERPSRTAWTSPVVTVINNQPLVLASGGGSLTAYDAASGQVVATLDGLTGNTIPSPTPQGDMIVIGAGENRMNPDPVASAKSNCLVRLTHSGGKFHFERLWQGQKAISHHASPVVHEGHVYFVTRLGLVYCLDLKTGAEKYSERLDDQVWATPIAAGEYIYFFGKSGITTVLKAGGEFDKVASNRLWSPEEYQTRLAAAKKAAAQTLPQPPEGKGPGGGPPRPKEEAEAVRYAAVGDVVYGVAAVDGAFFIRTGTELICIRHNPLPNK
ncbi:MAG: PQQ-binding-like beta-propeller repeat protein [Gemmataceae bacterium]|nr:PQQ-binding-like beta-propeller repeat protein [Gemmata sp.]MDW8198112.1 PQQ-binding-like beta-propeller repeat protein [Gemmataceae bacterium]